MKEWQLSILRIIGGVGLGLAGLTICFGIGRVILAVLV